jgi:hypothetical protein
MKKKRYIGWREYLSLPELGIENLETKIDTGAKTSSLHAYFIEEFEAEGDEYVRFGIHTQPTTEGWGGKICTAPLVGKRTVKNPGGMRQKRYVIYTSVRLEDTEWRIEINLTNRDKMKYKMLLGRSAVKGRFIIDPAKTFLITGNQQYEDRNSFPQT